MSDVYSYRPAGLTGEVQWRRQLLIDKVPDGDVRADSITAATPATAFIVDEHAAVPAHADPLR